MAPQLAYIGLGNMGHGMAKNLIEKGNLGKPLIVHNRTTSVAEKFAQEIGDSGKVVVVKSVDEAVSKADIVFTCLSNDKAITSTIEAAVKADVKGKLFVDNSTVHPDTTEMLAKTIEAQGGDFVAAPVFGAPPMAESGQLVTVLGGPANLVEKVKPYTKGVIGREDIDFSGQAPGKATLMKMLGNTFVLQMVEALGEGHTAAEKTGLGTENMHKFIAALFPGPYTSYSNRMLTGDYYNRDSPLFSATNARKDAGHALALANKAGAKMRAVEMIDQHLAEVEKLRGEKGDIAGIYGAIRVESGLPFENQKK